MGPRGTRSPRRLDPDGVVRSPTYADNEGRACTQPKAAFHSATTYQGLFPICWLIVYTPTVCIFDLIRCTLDGAVLIRLHYRQDRRFHLPASTPPCPSSGFARHRSGTLLVAPREHRPWSRRRELLLQRPADPGLRYDWRWTEPAQRLIQPRAVY